MAHFSIPCIIALSHSSHYIPVGVNTQREQSPTQAQADKPAAIDAAPGFYDGVHAVRFIKQGVPISIDLELTADAKAKGMKIVREGH